MNRRVLAAIFSTALVLPASIALGAFPIQDETQTTAAAETPNGAITMAMLASKLSLTDDQKSQIAPIIADRRTQMKALRNDASLGRFQRRREAKQIMEESDKKINAILTPDQRKQYAELEKEMRERMKERRSAQQQTGPN